jgi:hypothetical protein
MMIHTINENQFELKNDMGVVSGSLAYENSTFSRANMLLKEIYSISGNGTGIWEVYRDTEVKARAKSRIKTEAGGLMSIAIPGNQKKYLFKRSSGWKLRYFLLNSDGEELLSILAKVNWQKKSHDFILQVNEEFEKECDSFLILQALHCANCSLSMMNGGKVPALVSI